MKKTLEIFISILTFIAVTVAVLIFIWEIRSASVQKHFQKVKSKHINAQVDIYTNGHGIPHIIATNDNDMFFAVGYFHAKERLWQMFHNKLIAQGRTAEFYGEKELQTDKYMRTLNLQHIANQLYENANDETKNILTAYANGINAFIENNINNLSFEFGASDILPEHFHPSDCFLLQRYFAYIINPNFNNDIMFAEIANRIGIEKTRELIPMVNDKRLMVNDDTEGRMQYAPTNRRGVLHTPNNNINHLSFTINHSSGNFGSNTWVTNQNNTILANDSHLPLNIPGFWLQMHITNPNYNVIGLMLPGIPVFMCGRNNDIAWGSANMMVDDVDYKIIQNSKFKIQNDAIDTIKIRGKEPYIYYYSMVNGKRLIANPIQNSKFKIQNDDTINNFEFLIFNFELNWAGQHINKDGNNEIYAMLKVMRASNWKEFLAGVNNWHSPGMLFSYADKNGNIGLAPTVVNGPRLMVNKGKGEQTSPLQTDVTVGAGSARPTTNINHLLFTTNHYTARAKRIEEMLLASSNYTYRDAQYMQNDIYDLYAKELLSKIFYIFKKYDHLLTVEEKKAYYKLLNWDYLLSVNSTSAAIYSMFISKLVKNAFADKLGDLYDLYISNSNFALSKMMKLVDNPASDWFDDSRTPEREHLEFVVINSFKDAMEELGKLYGTTDSDKWKYGLKHTVNFRHSYNKFSFLDKATNIGSFSVSGGITTINLAEWNLNKPYDVIVGASMRFIADMNSDIVWTIISGGISGDPMSSNYSDQIKLWQIGAYIELSINEVPASDFRLLLSLSSIKN